MRLLVELRDTTRELIQAQLEDMPDEVITELQAKLNRQYDHYHNKFGLINSRGASLDMRDDSGYFLLCSLENLDSEGNFIGKSDMFSKRTIRAARPAERVETASEALALSVGERAGIDFGYMQQLTGKDKDTLVNDLQGVIFADPLEKNSDGEPRYYTADEYLSGDVRHKLQVAKLAAQNNPAFAVNVQALETVQPKDLEASEIAVRLGATWLAPELIKQFADELVDAPYYVRDRVKVLYIPLTGVWNVTNKSQTPKTDSILPQEQTSQSQLIKTRQQSLKRQRLIQEAVRRHFQKQAEQHAATNIIAPIRTEIPTLPGMSTHKKTAATRLQALFCYLKSAIRQLLARTARQAAATLLTLLGAGGVVLVLAMVIGAAAAVIGSPMGVLFADESGDPNSIRIAEIVAETNADFGEAINEIVEAHSECSETTIEYDYEDGHTWASYWPEVLAVFAVHTKCSMPMKRTHAISAEIRLHITMPTSTKHWLMR